MPQKQKIGKKQKKESIVADSSVTTEIVCIVDRSGSMQAIKNDAIGGFNNFLAEQQKEPGDATMTIILFDHEYNVLCSGKPLKDVQPFTDSTYVPRGSTALLDATGRAINEVNARNPKKALIVVLTDGHENSSHEFTKQQIKQMVSGCEKKGWAVMYLSADANAFEDGKSIGVGVNNVMQFASNHRGANVSTMAMSMAATDYRQHGIIGCAAQYSSRAHSEYDKRFKNPFQ